MIFFGLVLALILIYWRPQDAFVWLAEYRLVFIVMAGTFFMWIAKKIKDGTLKNPFIFSLDKFVLFFFLVVFISTYNYKWLKYTLDIFVEFSKILIFYILVSDCLEDIKKFNFFLTLLSTLTFLIAIIAVLQRFGIDLFNVGMIGGDRIQGLGIYQNPNYLAYSVAMVVPIQYFIFNRTSFILFKILNMLMLIVSYVCIFYTKSRGGLICIVCITMFMLFLRKPTIFRIIVGISAGVILLMLVIAVVPRFSSIGRQDVSIQERITSWYGALEMLKAHPIIGVGVGLFNEFFKGKIAHSSFVLVSAECGLLGLLTWIGMIYFAIKSLFKIVSFGKYKYYATALAGSVLAYVLVAFFAAFPYRITFFILCGLIAALVRIVVSEESIEHAGDKKYTELVLNKFKIVTNRDFVNIGAIAVCVIIFWHLVIKHRFQ